MRPSNMDCMLFGELNLLRAENRQIKERDQQFILEHLSVCEECRAEQKILGIMSDDDDGPLEMLDDLSRRRALDTILDRVDVEEEENEREYLAQGSRKYFFWGTGIAAVIALAAFLGALLSGPSTNKRSEINLSVFSHKAPSSIAGRVALVSGDQLAEVGTIIVGETLRFGEKVTIREGRGAFSLSDDIDILAGPGTELSFRRGKASEDMIELVLDSGEVVVSVRPGSLHPRFAVVTSDGNVEVKGTVFSVSALNSSYNIEVLRGEVELIDKSGRVKRLRAAQKTMLSNYNVTSLSVSEKDRLLQGYNLLCVADPSDSAFLEISSVPEGAEVVLDGKEVGRTPIALAVRAGHYELELRAEGRHSVVELIDVVPRAKSTRTYELLIASQEGASGGNQGNGSQAVLATGKRIGVSDPGAASFLDSALLARKGKSWAKAEQAYLDLIRRYPRSAEAQAALVSLGELQLGKLGKPGRALVHFDRYLTGGFGAPLAEEALFGRAGALRVLGKPSGEIESLKALKERFPSSIYAGQATRRLVELTTAKNSPHNL